MFATPLRFCGPIKNINCVFSLGNSHIGQIVALIGRKHFASDKKQGKCCKEILQTEGKRIEPWPKEELPPSWRCECPREPQPPNYDPYRIKVPDVVVPPLPPSNAKWTLWYDDRQGQQDQQTGQYHQDYHHQQQQQQDSSEKDETFLGVLKGFFDRLRGKSKREDDYIVGN